MKYRFSSYYLWGLRLFSLACFGAGCALWVCQFTVRSIFPYWLTAAAAWLVGLYYLFAIRKVAGVVLSEKGVTGRFLFRDYRMLSWDEIKEVGIGYHADLMFTHSWIYFSGEPLAQAELWAIDSKNVHKIRFSPKAVKAVQNFYHGEIKGLDENTRTVYVH